MDQPWSQVGNEAWQLGTCFSYMEQHFFCGKANSLNNPNDQPFGGDHPFFHPK